MAENVPNSLYVCYDSVVYSPSRRCLIFPHSSRGVRLACFAPSGRHRRGACGGLSLLTVSLLLCILLCESGNLQIWVFLDLSKFFFPYIVIELRSYFMTNFSSFLILDSRLIEGSALHDSHFVLTVDKSVRRLSSYKVRLSFRSRMICIVRSLPGKYCSTSSLIVRMSLASLGRLVGPSRTVAPYGSRYCKIDSISFFLWNVLPSSPLTQKGHYG